MATLAAVVILLNAMSVHAAVKPWPSVFRDQQIAVSGGTQYVRVGGQGPAVLLLHGFGDTGDMWIPLAEILVKDHAVIVPDLRGMGLSSLRLATLPAFSKSWKFGMLPSSPTTSATWSAMPWRRYTPQG